MSFVDILDKTLNEDLLICIMEFLECDDITLISRINTEFYEFFYNKILWKVLLKRDYNKIYLEEYKEIHEDDDDGSGSI